MNPTVTLTVSQLNFYIKSILDSDARMAHIAVRGEISNFTNHYRTGHLYFSIKDDKAAVKAVMFKSAASYLKFVPEDGMSVIALGRISVYERDGVYQLYVDSLEPDGAGALAAAYEQLKKKLEQEGLFAPEKKPPLPKYPKRVGVVTSLTGAAVRDIINVLSRRWQYAEIVLCGATVQGTGAADSVTEGIRRLNELHAADVIIVGRGGGSLEDLFAFNDEKLVRAVAESEIPIISAVGHETDFTLCDAAASLRAPTPSAAAELAVPDAREMKRYIDDCCYTMDSVLASRIEKEKLRLSHYSSVVGKKGFISYLERFRQQLDGTVVRLDRAYSADIAARRAKVRQYLASLDSLSPARVLLRGYAAIESEDGKIISGISDITPGERLNIRVHDGTAECIAEKIVRGN